MTTPKVDKSRCRIFSNCTEVKENCSGIMYWMCRDYRVQDNWSMLFAQKLAMKNHVPLYVCVFGKAHPKLFPTRRQYNFFIGGLKEVAEECEALNVKFYFINAYADSIVEIVKRNSIGAVVFDLFPLREFDEWIDFLKINLPSDVALVEVDAHNIVPVRVAYSKEAYSFYILRTKIEELLPKYLVDFPSVGIHEYCGNLDLSGFDVDIKGCLEGFRNFFECVELKDPKWAKPGAKEGFKVLRNFIKNGLSLYEKSASDVPKETPSNLSPWLHFGHISPQRCALEVVKHTTSKVFLENLIIRRELSDNYCHYNKNYDNFNGAFLWAKNTLNIHRNDKRDHIYTKHQFEHAETHDKIWNAAQNELLRNGKIQSIMRQYWGKKILEWTKTPEEAIEIAMQLNDTYSLDGCDPNGIAGVMWCICGIHDHPWIDWPVIGKVRRMVVSRLKKKFDVDGYVEKWGGKVEDEDEQPKKKLRRSKRRS